MGGISGSETRGEPSPTGAGTGPEATNAVDPNQSRGIAKPIPKSVKGSDYKLLATRLVQSRASIKALFDASLFADPAWDILLEIFLAEEDGIAASVEDVVLAATPVPRSTLLRWLTILEKNGLVERYTDPVRHGRDLVRLTMDGRLRLLRHLATVAALWDSEQSTLHSRFD